MIHTAALRVELDRLDALIERELQRMRARYQLSADEYHGLYITDQRVDDLVRSRVGADEGATAVREIGPARGADTTSRWAQLGAALELNDDERDVMLLALAPELDAKYDTLFAYLNDDVNRRWPTPELAERLFARTDAHRLAVRGALLPGARLLACGALQVVTASKDAARGRRGLRAAPPLADWLSGLPYTDERLLDVARFGAFEPSVPDEGIPAGIRVSLIDLAAALSAGSRLPPIVAIASTAAEAGLVGEELFARARRLALILDLSVLRASPAPDGIVQAIDLAQRVLGVGAVAAPLDALFEVDGRPFEAALTAVRRLARRSSALVLAGSGSVRAGNLFDTAIDLAVADPSPKERAATWRATLQRRAASTPAAVREAVVLALADRFALPMERILSAATAATERAAIARREVGERELFAAARAVSVADAAGTTQRLETIFDWNDLVLPDEVKRRLADVVHAISLRGQVLDDWSFARRVGGGRGARILLSGPSGTGKSTAAAIIAKALHLDLHRIELASVVSKYIGETEKNLDRAFTAARQANAILFIDEADALLGKRSAVKDAHDRYANVEVAYLLQKLEGDEIVIFATNLAQNLDEAFARRIQYAIEFPLPDPGSRERLWRNMIGPAPVEGALDFGFLARQFELSGGDIRNIVLDSAYRSAADGRPITLDQILLAVARQFVKSGRAPTAAEFREHYALLHETRSPLAASRDAALQPQTAP